MEFDFQYFIELFFGGLTRGSIYALIALGYTLVYGIIGLINFAHGEIYMVGAFTALLVAGSLGYMGFPAGGILIVAALAAVVWTAAYGFTLEKVAYKPLRNAPRLSPLISAIGMSTFLQNYVLLAQTSDFVPFPQLLPQMDFLSAIGDIMGPSDFLILVVSFSTMLALIFWIHYPHGESNAGDSTEPQDGSPSWHQRRQCHISNFHCRLSSGGPGRCPDCLPHGAD